MLAWRAWNLASQTTDIFRLWNNWVSLMRVDTAGGFKWAVFNVKHINYWSRENNFICIHFLQITVNNGLEWVNCHLRLLLPQYINCFFIMIFENITTFFSFRNMLRCFKHHHQSTLWIYSKDLQNRVGIYNYTYAMKLYKFKIR